jgi:hypothetical protein
MLSQWKNCLINTFIIFLAALLANPINKSMDTNELDSFSTRSKELLKFPNRSRKMIAKTLKLLLI